MNFRIAKTTRDILLEHAFDDYGKLLNEMSKITDKENVEEKITKIIQSYSLVVTKEYNVILRPSSKPRFDYTVLLRRKLYRNKKTSTSS